MAEWVSHLIVADRVLEQLPHLKRHEFCVGNIAPDCKDENNILTERIVLPQSVFHSIYLQCILHKTGHNRMPFFCCPASSV